nr:MAG TPA: hypothetical protein [Caudoviricetes sp.]
MSPYFRLCDKKSGENLYTKAFNLAKIIVL